MGEFILGSLLKFVDLCSTVVDLDVKGQGGEGSVNVLLALQKFDTRRNSR